MSLKLRGQKVLTVLVFFPEIAALVFSNIYVSIYAYVYRSFERFTYWG